VIYAGQTTPAPTDHTWDLNVQGVPVRSGGDDNEGLESNNAGMINLVASVPAGGANGLFRIDGRMSANEFGCEGDGFFETTGGLPILQVAGGLFALVGLAGLIFNAPPARTW
jgi:hypothetical protein